MLSTATTLIGAVLLAGTLSVDALSVSMSIGARMHGALMPQHYRTAIAWFAGLHAVVYSLGFLLGDSLAVVRYPYRYDFYEPFYYFHAFTRALRPLC